MKKLCLKPQCLPPPCLNSSYPEHNRSWDSPTLPWEGAQGQAQTASSPSLLLNSEGNQRQGVTQSVTILTLSHLPRLLAFFILLSFSSQLTFVYWQQTIMFYLVQLANILMPLQGIFFPQNSHTWEERTYRIHIGLFFFFFNHCSAFYLFLKSFILYWG